jgi:hypothetical protein
MLLSISFRIVVPLSASLFKRNSGPALVERREAISKDRRKIACRDTGSEMTRQTTRLHARERVSGNGVIELTIEPRDGTIAGR